MASRWRPYRRQAESGKLQLQRPGVQVEALKGELDEAHRAALAAEHRAETEAASAERQRAAAEELTAELDRVQVRPTPWR